jgi:hypothetical protein
MGDHSSMTSQEGVHSTKGCGDAQAGSTFHADPVLMGQDRTGSKKILINGAAIGIYRSEGIVDFNPGPIDGVPLWIQEVLAVPFISVRGLV